MAAVHPRGCGEHGLPDMTDEDVNGSSPRVRGTCRRLKERTRYDRFIPAGAGNINSSTRPHTTCPVHPRGCGEHRGYCRHTGGLTGSSPRVRGTFWYGNWCSIPYRFIPAGAGNISSQSVIRQLYPVHPRGCGEHFLSIGDSSTVPGSSPRVRGTLSNTVRSEAQERFIPAGAGNMSDPFAVSYTLSVHPRGCGEHNHQTGSREHQGGSSPRVRGTSFRAHRNGDNNRFIPAGAGNIVPYSGAEA